MLYNVQDVIDYVNGEDVKFIRLAFCDVFGRLKNISIMPGELERAFSEGISFDASAIRGFEGVERSDMLLVPDPTTLTVLPWRPSHGRVVRLFCDIKYPDFSPYELDSRNILKKAAEYAASKGIVCNFGSEIEFYLFKTDELGEKTDKPFDNAGYMDVAPDDKCENLRREICLTLEEMDITPESSHHEEGPGQNEIDFRYSSALTSADNAVTFKTVVHAVAARNGLWASFSPKPIEGKSGNGMHINMSVNSKDSDDYLNFFMAGILRRIKDMTLFLNSTEASYKRLGEFKAPMYISWSAENRSQLIRVPAAKNNYKRIELRSPDPEANIYVAYALLIYAGIEGIEGKLKAPESSDIDLFSASDEILTKLEKLPTSLPEAAKAARESEFIKKYLPERFLASFLLN